MKKFLFILFSWIIIGGFSVQMCRYARIAEKQLPVIIIAFICCVFASCGITNMITYRNGHIMDTKGKVIGYYANGYILDIKREVKGNYSN